MIRVLIIDPSRDFRETLKHALERAEDVEVTATVPNKTAAVASLVKHRPDVAVFDVEMPGALEALKDIQQFNEAGPEEGHVGVILIAHRRERNAEKTIKALEAGAFDFVLMPESTDMDMVLQSLCRQLFVKMRNYSSKRIFSSIAGTRQTTRSVTPKQDSVLRTNASKIKAVLIGVSTGGPKVLSTILPRLCELVDLPICVVQHMPPNFTSSLAASLDAKCSHLVREARDGDLLEKGRVYLAPGGRHLVFTRCEGGICLQLDEGPPEDGCRPSVNVLFRSAAKVLRGDVVVLVLTGMGADGSKALLELKEAGAYIIAQDKDSSVVWGMPGSAVATGCVDRILPPEEVPAAVLEAIRGGDDDLQ